MKLSLTLLALASQSVVGFVPVATSATSSSALYATVENTKLIPPKKVEDLAETAGDLYETSVQKTYGYVFYSVVWLKCELLSGQNRSMPCDLDICFSRRKSWRPTHVIHSLTLFSFLLVLTQPIPFDY